MATNSDALSAIEDIEEAMEEYGSDIIVLTYVAGETDSYGNVITPESWAEDAMKGLISSEASESVAAAYKDGSDTNTFELSIKLYSENVITKDNKLTYLGHEHEIVYVSSKVLQNTTLLYEVLIKR